MTNTLSKGDTGGIELAKDKPSKVIGYFGRSDCSFLLAAMLIAIYSIICILTPYLLKIIGGNSLLTIGIVFGPLLLCFLLWCAANIIYLIYIRDTSVQRIIDLSLIGDPEATRYGWSILTDKERIAALDHIVESGRTSECPDLFWEYSGCYLIPEVKAELFRNIAIAHKYPAALMYKELRILAKEEKELERVYILKDNHKILKALKKLQGLAGKGNSLAVKELAEAHKEGLYGLKKNPEEAERLLKTTRLFADDPSEKNTGSKSEPLPDIDINTHGHKSSDNVIAFDNGISKKKD